MGLGAKSAPDSRESQSWRTNRIVGATRPMPEPPPTLPTLGEIDLAFFASLREISSSRLGPFAPLRESYDSPPRTNTTSVGALMAMPRWAKSSQMRRRTSLVT